jgi:hypothetical protein
MQALSAAELITHWTPGSALAPHARMAALLACVAPAPNLAADTLGMRNQRLLSFYRALSDAPLEAWARCPGCATDVVFEAPVADLLACPPPPPDAVAEVGTARLRLPRMSDLDALGGLEAEAAPAALAARCRLDDGEPFTGPEVDALAHRFEALDPAADVAVGIDCAACGSAYTATVDVAGFVAHALDRLVHGLYRDIDALARAYGWSEADILALPPARRHRYVVMVAAADAAPWPRAVGG